MPWNESVHLGFYRSSNPLVLQNQGGPGHRLIDTREQQPSQTNCSGSQKRIANAKTVCGGSKTINISLERKVIHHGSRNTTLVNSACPSNWTAPWQVGLMFLTSNQRRKRCGGVLVHRRWVLTAAHCLDNTTGSPYAMVGSKKYLHGFFSEGQVLRVEKSIVHENYRPVTKFQPPLHDIALLRLSSDVQLGDDVSLARIPKRNSSLSRTTKMVISGWSITGTNHTSQEQLRCARVPLVSLQDCQSVYHQLGVSGIRSSHVCAGYPSGGVGPCNGDSGGGLVHGGSDGTNTVIGIISWSQGCGKYHGVYTNVQKHRSWLLETLQN